jgi:hypothetical protein
VVERVVMTGADHNEICVHLPAKGDDNLGRIIRNMYRSSRVDDRNASLSQFSASAIMPTAQSSGDDGVASDEGKPRRCAGTKMRSQRLVAAGRPGTRWR